MLAYYTGDIKRFMVSNRSKTNKTGRLVTKYQVNIFLVFAFFAVEDESFCITTVNRICLIITVRNKKHTWLVNAPGVKRPAIGVAPVCAANLSTARCPKGRDEMTNTSAGFSIATTARAASTSFSQVRRRLITWVPSARRLYTYVSI